MSQEIDKTAQARLLGDRPPQQIRVHLRPAEQLPTDEFSLSIWANTSWFINWVTQNHLEEITIPPCTQPKKPMRVHLWLTQEHLRFRYLPPTPSILTLFGQNLSINHQALLLNLSVNCWVELEELTHHTIRGKILSGSIQLTDLDQTVYAFADLENLIEQLWPDKSGTERVRSMILGRSSFQMEIAAGVKRRRIAFLGKTQDMQAAGREGRLWQMIAPPDEIGSTEDYEVPSQQLEEILNTLRAAAATNQLNTPLSIRRGSTQGEEAGIFYHIIKIGDEVEKREIIKPDVDLLFRNPAGQTTWTPQTLRIEPLGNQTKRYELVDVDQVKWLKRGQFIALETESVNSTENASGKVFEVSWNQASIPSPQVIQLPAMCLTGTASQVTAGATVVWQFGQLQEDGVNRPANVPGWIRYQIDPVPMPSKSVERGLRRLDYLTDKFIFEQVQDCRWEVDVAQGAKGGSPQAFKSRLKAELTIISESGEQHALTSLKLTITEPEVRATTPNLHFFKAPGDRSLLDPKFLPNGKTLKSVLVKTALIFRTHDPSPTGIRLTLDGERRLTIRCDDNQVAAYVPTGQALIDPISPTGTNLVSTAGVSKEDISRDPNHGLVPVLLKQFYLDIPKDALDKDALDKDASELARLICPTGTSQEPDPKMKSVLALLPWVEWEGDSQTNTSLTLHHRNLVLEQDEFLSAKEDSGTITNSRFSFKDFVAAVRDRYTQASDSLRPTSRLKNWLPGAVLQDEGGNQLTPELTIDTDNTGLPRVKLTLKSPSGELSQYLSLQTRESWLQFGLNWQGLSAEQAPIFELKADTNASLVNSAAPLVFDQSQRYVYDNLGVIREQLPAFTESPWLIERIRYPQDSGTYQTVYSVSFNDKKALIQSGDAKENSTQISFTCAALKLQKDGTLVDADALFSTARFELGSYGFFRTPTPPGWKDLDCWPRLAGMPIFVTKLLRLELEIDKPKTIQFQAVLVNPYDVAENYQPGQQAVPSFVGEAIARGSLLTITLTANGSTFDLTEVKGNIDWTFSLTAQSPPLDPPAFPGRLARLVGTVKLEKGKLAIEPKPEKCQAYVFGQLWSLQECPTLECTGNQTSITVQAKPIGSGNSTLTIACKAPQSGTLEFNLPVQIESPIAGYDFKAAIKSVEQQSDDKPVKLHLQLVSPNGEVTEAFAAIVQGMYYGFFLEKPIDYKEKNTRSYQFGRSLLVLWLESQTSDPKLGGVLIREDAPKSAQLTLIAPNQAAVTPSQKMTLKGVRMRMQIVSSNPASPQQEILSWYLKNDSKTVSLHIGEQVVETPINPSDSSPPNSRLTGYLVWKPESNESPEIQGPIVLQHYQNDKYEVIPAVYYAQRVNVEPESGTTQRDFSLPRLPPDTPSQDFDLVETSRTSSQENGFVKLRFNGTTFELAKLAAGQVPIDLYLDQEFIQAIATLPLKVPQLIHREVYGARLRMAIADFEGIDSTYEFSDEAVPWSVREHQWLLDPVVKDNLMSQIMLLQGSLFLKPGSGTQKQEFQTENLFVIQRPLELPDEPMSAIARLPLTNLLSVTSRIQSNQALSVFFDEQQVEDYLLKKGASGIAVHRLLLQSDQKDTQEGDRGLYRFMPSPFYAGGLTASASKEASEGVSLARAFQPLTAEKLSNTSPSKHTQAATPLFLDFRLLLPQNLVNVQLKLLNRYWPVQSSSTPSNQSSLPQRVIKFERNVPQPNISSPDLLEHHIHALEATAFAQMEPLGFPPEFVVSSSDTEPKPVTFLPQNLELRYAADKPGAMFHHKLQAYTVPKSKPAVEVELMTDVAVREPQQFKPPVGAAIKITLYHPEPLTTLKLTNVQFRKIKLQWKEVLGQVALKELTNKQPIAVKDDKLAAEPFKLIVQIEQSVQEIRRTDAVIPITATTDGATSTIQRIYIVTRLQDLGLGIALKRENEPEPAQYKLFIENENFETYFQQVKDVNTDPYIVWEYKGGIDWSKLTKLKAVWQSTTKTDEKPPEIPKTPVPYFEYQIQRIPPSGLSAKIAVIHSLRRKGRPNLDRTLLFGNAASLDTGKFEIQKDEFQFSTEGEDTVDAIVNNLPDASEHLFLVKYLTEGQTLFTQR